MKTNLTMPKISVLFSFLALLFSANAYAQPANDNCGTAEAITIGADESECTEVSGTTLNATQSASPTSVCSGTWFADDVWYAITTPATLGTGALIVKVNYGTESGDLPSVGMAFYADCGDAAIPFACFSDGTGTLNEIKIFPTNLAPSTTYYIRVWSGVSATDDSGSFRICSYFEAGSNDVVIWGGNPGEGDFSTGLIDTVGTTWTYQSINGDTSVWRYKACSCSNGLFRSSTVSSPTSFNGAAVFDADSMNTVFGAPPGPPYPQMIGELISPIIDGTTFASASLKFFQAYSPLNGSAFFAYSLDGGGSWSPDIEVSPEIAGNGTAPVPSEQRFFLPELAGESQIRIKFTFSGDFYYWILDDVQLIEPENNNLVVMSNFFAIAPNAQWPSSQVEEFSFLADVANIGAKPQPNTNLNVTIVDDNTGDVVYTTDLSYGEIPADSLIQNEPFAGCFTPDGTLTSYTGTYTISSDSVDFDPSNNTQEFQFSVVESVFAKELGATRTIVPAGANWDPGEPHSWAFGNFYHIVNGSDAALPADQWYAKSIDFGVGNGADLIGTILTIYLYEWTADTNMDGDMDPDERTPVGFANYEITGFETTTELINIEINPFPTGLPGELVPLNSGGNYVAMVEYLTGSETDDFAMLAAEPWDYAAQTFRSNPAVITDPEFQKPYRPAEMLGIAGDLSSEPYGAAGFNGNNVPAIRLNLALDVEISVDVLDPENLVTVSPNPASDFINLNVDLIDAQDQVEVHIMDASGKVVLNRLYSNVTKETFTYNVSNFASGAYLLNFITEEGVRTERFIIQR
ncbi:MAG: hypothetical protein ACI8P3_000621 [Saprospiraceae bacterium]|jgi:hypothetical protein